MEELHKIRIKKVLGPTQTGTAVLLGNEKKTFVMFIGLYEGAAIIRELNGEVPARPLTHELLTYILDGFDIQVKQIVISDIVNNTFCATLVLEQKVTAENEEWVGKRNEVHIDARPSDCLIIALKEKKDIYCTPRVFDKVRDVSEEIGIAEKEVLKSENADESEGITFTKPDFLNQKWDEFDLDLDREGEEDEGES
ncbi:MAG TPA: bifunctional nuclease family protein [Planctomycetota bacterium]|nr:bifunctional nuclease family protein [Planctomycetota bacterium]